MHKLRTVSNVTGTKELTLLQILPAILLLRVYTTMTDIVDLH